jgi:FkbM family methyltransferase
MSHTFTDPDLAELDRIWPLGRQLVVPEHGDIIVVGAYEGRYMAYFRELFPTASLTGYEPQMAKFEVLKSRFANQLQVILFNAGLATAARSVHLGNWGTDGATVATTDDHAYGLKVKMWDAVEELSSHLSIDLLLLNCEGSEWPLIPYILDEMMHHRIRTMAIQFHPKYVSREREARVFEYLLEYYTRPYWDYPTWTYWQRRDQ